MISRQGDAYYFKTFDTDFSHNIMYKVANTAIIVANLSHFVFRSDHRWQEVCMLIGQSFVLVCVDQQMFALKLQSGYPDQR